MINIDRTRPKKGYFAHFNSPCEDELILTNGQQVIKFFIKFKIFYILPLYLFIAYDFVFANNDINNILRQKLSDITYTQEIIAEKIKLSVKIKDNLINNETKIIQKITGKKKSLNINNCQTADQLPLMQFDLTLIQLLRAYIAELSQKIILLKNCNTQLDFLYNQAEDSLMINKTIKNLQINELILKIDKTLETNQNLIEKEILSLGFSQK